MSQQNKVVDTIINRIISRSRKNSLESLDCQAISEKNESGSEEDPADQEYIIKKSDLKYFIQKMAQENYQNNIALEQKIKENQQIKNQTSKWKTNMEQLKKTLEAREQIFKKRLEQAEGKILKEKKKREQMELEINWSTNKIKEQMKQIQKMKHSALNKNTSKSENSNALPSNNKEKSEYVTPAKEGSKKLQNLGARNCESIEYSLLNSDVVPKFGDHCPATIRECSTQQSKQRNCVLNSLQNHSSKKNMQTTNIEMSRFHRHAQIDQKERLLKFLGEKCLYLEAHIEKLTKKYLGEVVYNEETERQKQLNRSIPKVPNDILKVIDEQSGSSLHRSESEVGLSSAFKVQPEL